MVARNLFRRTIANISDTATAIAAGDFAQRVKLSGRGDEFDQLAETINDMLERIARLMDGAVGCSCYEAASRRPLSRRVVMPIDPKFPVV